MSPVPSNNPWMPLTEESTAIKVLKVLKEEPAWIEDNKSNTRSNPSWNRNPDLQPLLIKNNDLFLIKIRRAVFSVTDE